MRFWIAFLIFCSTVNAEIFYEGTSTFRGYGRVDLNWLVQFLPYNPIIVEVGAYCGDQVLYASKVWPKSQIIAFEPNPRAYAQLQIVCDDSNLTNVKAYNLALNTYHGYADLYLSRGPTGKNRSYEKESSLLPPIEGLETRYQGPTIEVPCVVFDEWCVQNHIDHIDILRLELEGFELDVLKSSPQILQKTKILILPSFFTEQRIGMVNYFWLKDFLVHANFVPLAHWYEQGDRGLAVYICQELYDAYFIKCLGLGLGGLLYP
jgi:FkbM family methyltransferase